MKYSSWGNLKSIDVMTCDVPESFKDRERKYLPIGSLKSYGDQALGENAVAVLTFKDTRVLNFQPDKYLIKVESGMSLRELQRFIRPFGVMIPVLPGTQEVTVGGSIASDVHGKNHHIRGSFGEWVNEITLLRSDLGKVVISRQKNPELFFATIGGCGLTGVIVDATLRLVPDLGNSVLEERFEFKSIKEFVELSTASLDWESSVGWLNLYGKNKGIFFRGRRIFSKEVSKKVPDFTFPPWAGPPLINKVSSSLLSAVYSTIIRSNSQSVVSEEKHYFPLDRIKKWNRAYGSNGFYQYQFVVPWSSAIEACTEILKLINRHRLGSFLTVIKVFGERSSGGLLSFPMPGITVAIDFPNSGRNVTDLLQDLDSLVESAKGRLYLAKDARMSREMFWATYPNVMKFIGQRDPAITSNLSQRLLGV